MNVRNRSIMPRHLEQENALFKVANCNLYSLRYSYNVTCTKMTIHVSIRLLLLVVSRISISTNDRSTNVGCILISIDHLCL